MAYFPEMSHVGVRTVRTTVFIAACLLAIGAQIQCPGAVEARPSLDDLQDQIDEMKAELDLQPVVVDANGIRLGTVVVSLREISEFPMVVIDEPGIELFAVQVMRENLVSVSGPHLQFESADCSGPPMMSRDSTFTLPRAFIHRTRSDIAIYIPDSDPNSQVQVDLQSRMGPDTDVCMLQNDPGSTVVPAIPVFIWQDRYTPPFGMVTRGDWLSMQGP